MACSAIDVQGQTVSIKCFNKSPPYYRYVSRCVTHGPSSFGMFRQIPGQWARATLRCHTATALSLSMCCGRTPALAVRLIGSYADMHVPMVALYRVAQKKKTKPKISAPRSHKKQMLPSCWFFFWAIRQNLGWGDLGVFHCSPEKNTSPQNWSIYCCKPCRFVCMVFFLG